ncbi:sulfite exporter TauE/SafE family protein [Neisseria leonii]|uniref:sulfite exporter TauE/SafE family protein n=1 Tax=Neisseria leonii TaxID=2995413 RepID=UPI00237A5724|nr:sulfite exporter TauE/SafE family protein [Neisseria sp. 3986]MDD9325459.1 sulfite exporter TauE/SafE family protein [Neisseria sp. 3986]
MISDIGFLSLFFIGFFGGTHCLGMCGPLSSAFSLQLPPNLPRFWLVVLLNLGRITGYTLIGLLLGALGQFGIALDDSRWLQNILFASANLLMLFLGLYLAGLSGLVRKIESLGRPIWRQLNPVMNRLLPIRSAPACFGVGLLWGWLPCGLVYTASLYALGSGNALQGGLTMLAFALGTLPNLLAVGWFSSQLTGIFQHRRIRFTAGLLIAAWAVWRLAVFAAGLPTAA